jgi:hypothetical protein
LAVAEGLLAGAAAARSAGIGRPPPQREQARLRRRRDRLRSFADAMHRAHPLPAGWVTGLAPDTVICRCEEVPYGTVAAALTHLGATDARTVKLLARPGMGWCQGRVCGEAIARLTATHRGREVTPEDLATFAGRPLAAPVRLADLAFGGQSPAFGQESVDGGDVG